MWATVLGALLLGLLVQALSTGGTNTAAVAGGSIAYPSTWVRESQPGSAFAVTDLRGGGIYGAHVAVRSVPRALLEPAARVGDAAAGGPANAATNWALLRAEELQGHRILGIQQSRVDGREAATIEYAYLADAPMGAASGAMPGLLRARDTLVQSSAGDQYYVLTFAADPTEFERLTGANAPLFRNVYDGILGSWRIP